MGKRVVNFIICTLGVVSKQVSSASQIADKALGPPRTLSPVATSPGPGPDTLFKGNFGDPGVPEAVHCRKSR
jgi:hypothetical protein